MNIIDLATKTMQTAIRSTVDAIKTVVDGTKTKVDTIDARTNTMNTNINTINTNVGTLINGRVVKSVQRGVRAGSGSTTISTVNPSKCMVLINGFSGEDGFGKYALPYVLELTSTKLTIAVSGKGTSAEFSNSWEVIEFY